MSELAWGLKVSEEFRRRLFRIVDDFGWGPDNANNLMACMAWESNETFSPSIKNFAGSGATGLIQFMPKTAQALGTSVEDLAEMTAEDQLWYVKSYFRPYHKRIFDLSDMYMAILMPRYVGLPEGTAIFRIPGIAYRQNSGLDSNRDGVVTKAEATEKVRQKLIKGLLPQYCYKGE